MAAACLRSRPGPPGLRTTGATTHPHASRARRSRPSSIHGFDPPSAKWRCRPPAGRADGRIAFRRTACRRLALALETKQEMKTRTQEPIRIGMLFSETGVTSVIEDSERMGTLLAVQEIN